MLVLHYFYYSIDSTALRAVVNLYQELKINNEFHLYLLMFFSFFLVTNIYIELLTLTLEKRAAFKKVRKLVIIFTQNVYPGICKVAKIKNHHKQIIAFI